jgi:hypothetical protein
MMQIMGGKVAVFNVVGIALKAVEILWSGMEIGVVSECLDQPAKGLPQAANMPKAASRQNQELLQGGSAASFSRGAGDARWQRPG